MAESNRGSISGGQRSGKYRHLFGEPAKPEACYSEIKNPSCSGESTYVKANSKYFAVAKAGGGGPVYIRRLDCPGRFLPTTPTISVHKGTALDFDFHPFVDNMIATCSEDTHVCVTKFPAEGLKQSIQDPDVRLQGHGKKVALVEFNPSASSILASGAFDHSIRVWNIESGKNICTYEALDDNIYSMGWNYDGSLLGATAKDKKLQIFDPRQSKPTHVVESFDGAKASKLFWIPCLNWIGATGHTKQAKRQIKLWDLNNMSKPLEVNTIDQASSIMQPMYDNDNGVLYLVGKGDGTITYYELVNDDKKMYLLSIYRNQEPQKGGGWVPKKGLDVWKCEVARFLKLTSKSIIPISFIVPRKSGEEVFQADIFPDAFAGKPALSAEEWLSGQNKAPVLMSLDPSVRQDLDSDCKTNDVEFKKRSYEEVIEENARLKERVKELEIKLGIYNPPKDEINEETNEDAKVDDNEESANKSNENIIENNPTDDNNNEENLNQD